MEIFIVSCTILILSFLYIVHGKQIKMHKMQCLFDIDFVSDVETLKR